MNASPFNPQASVKCAAWYDARLRRIWTSERPEFQRLQLVLASYNAGGGHIIKAQQRCDGAPAWEQIAPCLPQITGHHARETQDYVRLIQQHYQSMTAAPH